MPKIAAFMLTMLLLVPACASDPREITGKPQRLDDSAPSSPRTSSGSEEPIWEGPDFSVETFDGETFTLAEQAGTPVVLNFWESW